MKSKIFLLSLTALTLAFTACNKNQDEPRAAETDATISVAVHSADLRAYEDGAGSEDMKIRTLAVMIYQGEAQVAYKEVTDGSLEVKDIETTAGPKKIVVAANYAGTEIKGLALAKLLALTHDLTGTDQMPAEGTLMLTAQPVEVTLVKGKNYYGYASAAQGTVLSEDPIRLQHIHAGMSLTGVQTEFSDSYRELYGVSFDNDAALIALIAKKQSNVFGATTLVNDDAGYLYGQKLFGTKTDKYTPAEADYAEMSELRMPLAADQIKPDGMTGCGYYVLENNSAEHPTILCLKGTLVQADGSALTGDQAAQAAEAGWIVSATDHSTYYPVLVNWEKDGYTYTQGHTAGNGIVRGYKYDISLTITGPGTNSPEDPANEKANLDVKCEVAPWIIVSQNVVW